MAKPQPKPKPVTGQPRKPSQIAVCRGGDITTPEVVALCSDGTIWRMDVEWSSASKGDATWIRLPDIPNN